MPRLRLSHGNRKKGEMQSATVRTNEFAHLYMAAYIFWILALLRDSSPVYFLEIFIGELSEFLFLWLLWFHILKVLIQLFLFSSSTYGLGTGTHWHLPSTYVYISPTGQPSKEWLQKCIFTISMDPTPPLTFSSSWSESCLNFFSLGSCDFISSKY